MVNSNGNGDYAEAEYLRKIFIGGLTSTTTDEGLQQYFEKWGTVVDAVVMKDPKTRKSRGFGFITYSESSMVDAAQQARPHTIDGRTVEAKRAVPREDVGRPEISGNSQKIYVGRLGTEITEDDLREHFESYGNITGVNIVKDKEGQSRGFGFVEFDDSDPVDKLVLKKDHEIKGKDVDVKKSQPKQRGGDGDNSRQGGGRNQINQGGFRGNNSNNNWGRNQGNNFGGNAWNQNNSNSGYGGNNSGNSAWSNNSSGNFGNNSGGGFDNNYGGGWNNYSGGNAANNFGNQGFGNGYGGGNNGGNFNSGNSYGSGNQQFGSGGGNFGNAAGKSYNNGGGFRNFSGNGNNFGGGNQMRKGGIGPIRNQNTGNRQRPFGNRNAGGIGGGNFGN